MIPVKLNELEDQSNQTNDQNTDLDKIRKRDHCQPPFLCDRGVKKYPPMRPGGYTACRLSAAPLQIEYHNRQKMTSP